MNRWVNWVRNDAGLLSRFHVLAADGMTTACGLRIPAARRHKEWHIPESQSYSRGCARCNAIATREPTERPDGAA